MLMSIFTKSCAILVFCAAGLLTAQNSNFEITGLGAYVTIQMKFTPSGSIYDEHIVGVIELEDTDTGETKNSYCIQALVNTSIGETYTRDSITENDKLAYILDHYYPTTSEPSSLAGDEYRAMAVQFAIWLAVGDFTTDYLLDLNNYYRRQSNAYNKWQAIQAAVAIFENAPDSYDKTPQLSIQQNPEGVMYIQRGDVCNLETSLTSLGIPLENTDVTLTMVDTDFGPSANESLWENLAPVGAVKTFQTDSDGACMFSYQGENPVYDKIIASSTPDLFYIYELVNPSGRQSLVTRLDEPMTVETEIQIQWDDGIPPVAVELSSFAASITREGNRIVWTTESEIKHAGFNVYRAFHSDGNYTRLNDILIINPENRTPHTYEYLDKHFSGSAFYKLEEVEIDGSTEFFGPVACESAVFVQNTNDDREFTVLGNYPNPFNAFTTIEINIPEQEYVRIQIYNITGELVHTLVASYLSNGPHRFLWNGTDANGKSLPSGVYFYSVQSSIKTIRGRMNMIK